MPRVKAFVHDFIMMMKLSYQKIFPFMFCTIFLLMFWALVLTLILYALVGNNNAETEEQEKIDSNLKIVMTFLLSLMLTVDVSGNSLTIIALCYVR